jgi:hypothetical protein
MHDFPRPYSVVQAETQRRAGMTVTLEEPTYAEAVDLQWAGVALGAMTIKQLVETAAEAQRLLAAGREMREPVLIEMGWRAHRGALLVLAFRSVQRIGGPFHA